jgi:hypothetical protein
MEQASMAIFRKFGQNWFFFSTKQFLIKSIKHIFKFGTAD